MTVFQVWTYKTADEFGQTGESVSPCFAETDETGARAWANNHVANTPDEYALVLKIKVGRYRGGSNMVVGDTREAA